jgi:hypothetical protein
MQKNQIIIIILWCVIVVQKPILPYIASNNVIYKMYVENSPHFLPPFFYTHTRHFKHMGTREE